MNKINTFIALISLSLLPIFAPVGVCQTPELVKNIETSVTSQFSGQIGTLNNVMYFAVKTADIGTELFRSDGSAAGTALFADLAPGQSSSSPVNFILLPRGTGDLLFFSATKEGVGNELWRTDGTPGGTFPLDINAGPEGSVPRVFIPFGDKLLFTAERSGEGREVFITDGTLAGTQQLTSNAPGPIDGYAYFGGDPQGFVVINPELPSRKAFFMGFDGVGFQFFSTQGTSASTAPVTNLPFFALDVSSAGYVGSTSAGIFFAGEVESPKGTELYRLDPQSLAVTLVADLRPENDASSYPQDLAILGDKVIFSAETPELGRELYIYTPGVGVNLLADLAAGPDSTFDTFSFTTRIGVMGNFAYFSPDAEDTDSNRVFSTDGTFAGTNVILSNARGFFSVKGTLFEGVGGHTYFHATSSAIGDELFRTDGTPASTVALTDIFPEGGSSVPAYSFATSNSKNYFLANTSQSFAFFENSGAPNANTLVKNLLLSPEAGSLPNFQFDTVNGKLVFSAFTNKNGTELYATDGSSESTKLLRDILPGDRTSSPTMIASLPGKILLRAADLSNGYELWATDGTPEGTALLKDIAAGPKSGLARLSNMKNAKLTNSVAFFAANDGIHGTELWKSDGTAGGTVLVKDIRIGGVDGLSVNSNSPAVVHDNKLYFEARDSGSNSEPWISDGTEAGTQRLADLFPGASGSFPTEFKVFQSGVIFVASASGFGRQLWKTDGSAAGTLMITSQNAPSGIAPQNVFVGGDRVFFSSFTNSLGSEPWVSDGTNAGTLALGDLSPGNSSSSPIFLYTFKGKTYFTADTPNLGRELWVTDGTPANTTLFKDMNPGESSASISNFSEVEGKIYFHASFAGETFLYESDGTPAGTIPVTISANAARTLGSVFTRGQLFFPGFDEAFGSELFKIVFDGCPDDSLKKAPGVCGCGIVEEDRNFNGVFDCQAGSELKLLITTFKKQFKRLTPAKNGRISKKQRSQIKRLKGLLANIKLNSTNSLTVITTKSASDVGALIKRFASLSNKAFKINSTNFARAKRRALVNMTTLLGDIQG